MISAQFTHNHKQALTVPHGRTARVAGELADDAGDAISGATVCVEMQTQGSRRGLVPVGTATTDAHGHFVYTVPKGPNRRVLVGYRHDSFQVARSIRYYAHAKPTIHIRRGGSDTAAGSGSGASFPARMGRAGSSSCRRARCTRGAGSPSAGRRPTSTACSTAATASERRPGRSPIASGPSSPASAATRGRSATANPRW